MTTDTVVFLSFPGSFAGAARSPGVPRLALTSGDLQPGSPGPGRSLGPDRIRRKAPLQGVRWRSGRGERAKSVRGTRAPYRSDQCTQARLRTTNAVDRSDRRNGRPPESGPASILTMLDRRRNEISGSNRANKVIHRQKTFC